VRGADPFIRSSTAEVVRFNPDECNYSKAAPAPANQSDSGPRQEPQNMCCQDHSLPGLKVRALRILRLLRHILAATGPNCRLHLLRPNSL